MDATAPMQLAAVRAHGICHKKHVVELNIALVKQAHETIDAESHREDTLALRHAT